MRTPVLILINFLIIFALGACGGASEPMKVTRSAPVVILPAAPGRPGVAYFALPIVGDPGALVSVTSPRIGRIEMHESMTSGNMTSMRPLSRVAVTNGEDLIFESGGRHLMLFDIDPTLRPGEMATLTFNFERGNPTRLAAVVEAPGEHAGH